MKISRTVIYAIVSGSILVVVLGIYGTGVYFIAGMEEKFVVEQQQLLTTKKQIEDEQNLSRLLENTKEERAELESYLIEQTDIIDFLSVVEALGRTHGAVVSTESLNVLTKDEFTEELSLSLRAVGSREAVLHVLALLEILPYKSYVSSAAISASTGEVGQNGRFEGTFTIIVAKHKEPS